MPTNPYEPPKGLSEIAHPTPHTPAKRLGWTRTLLYSWALSVLGGLSLLLLGYCLGLAVYNTDSAEWNSRIYPIGVFGQQYEEKVRIQTGLRFAKNLGTFGFWSGLLAPWIRYLAKRLQNDGSP